MTEDQTGVAESTEQQQASDIDDILNKPTRYQLAANSDAQTTQAEPGGLKMNMVYGIKDTKTGKCILFCPNEPELAHTLVDMLNEVDVWLGD